MTVYLMVTFFFITSPALAQNESFGVSKIYVNGQPVKMLEAIGLTDRELIEGKIVIEGVSDASEVDYSIDAGKSWEKVPVENKIFKIEYDPGDNSRDYTLLLKSTSGTQNFAIVIRFQNRKYFDQFHELFNEMRDYWIDERLHEFLPYFAEDEYDNFTQLEENLEDTFDAANQKTFIVDSMGNNATKLQELADSLGIETGTLPSSQLDSEADFIVIVGSDKSSL